MPKVTVLLPTLQSGRHLAQTLESIRAQTFQDYELLVVDDGSTDQTLSLLGAAADPRLRVIQGKRTGLADALNLGIASALGEYVARIDGDDRMVPERLEKQARYMDAHPETVICGGWQQYFGLSTFLHAPPSSDAQCRANLLFRCDLCHSTLMLRKSVFIEHQLWYDSRFAAEDFQLWTRVQDYGKIANLPEILGYYREDGRSITSSKKQRLIRENGEIVAATLERALQIHLTPRQRLYFAGWINPFYQRSVSRKERAAAWADLQSLFRNILCRNRSVNYYQEEALRAALRAEWLSLRYNLPFVLPAEPATEELLFQKKSPPGVFREKLRSFCRNYKGIYRKYKKLCMVLHRPANAQQAEKERET